MLKDFDLPRRGRSSRGGGRSVDCLAISSLGSGGQPSTDDVTDVLVVALGNKLQQVRCRKARSSGLDGYSRQTRIFLSQTCCLRGRLFTAQDRTPGEGISRSPT